MEENVQPAILELGDASRDFLAGGFAGMFGVVAGAPLDVVRIRQQQPGQTALPVLQVVKSLISREGNFSVFKGMAYPLCTASFQNAVVFHSYGAASRFASSSDGSAASEHLSYKQTFMAGCFAGAIQTAIVTPVDLLKIRLQLQTSVPGSPGYQGPWSMLKHVVRAEGVPGLFRGAMITTIRDVPSYGVYYTVYTACRGAFDPGVEQQQSIHPLSLCAAGGLAGILSWVSVYAFDVIKSRIQATTAQASPYKGWLDCAWKSYRQEGTAVFLRGFWATMARAFVVNGAIFTAYELSHSLLLNWSQTQAGLEACPASSSCYMEEMAAALSNEGSPANAHEVPAATSWKN